jgi:RNA polymerase sigma factor (TIGR02999 family)
MSGEVTRLLAAHAGGDPRALDALLPLVYDQLRRVARARLRGERPEHTLQPTALVHEAFLELLRFDRLQIRNREHFFALAARAMRRVLIDHAVARRAEKRGGGLAAEPLGGLDVAGPPPSTELLALGEALERLEALEPRHAHVVECRLLAGLSLEETASALGTSPATVSRDWALARAWLNRELAGDTEAAGPEASEVAP